MHQGEGKDNLVPSGHAFDNAVLSFLRRQGASREYPYAWEQIEDWASSRWGFDLDQGPSHRTLIVNLHKMVERGLLCERQVNFGNECDEYWGLGCWIAPGADNQPSGFIYFIEAEGAQRIKIGYSKNPDRRLRSLSTGSPMPLRLLAQIPGNQADESKIQRQFAELRLEGEWFYATAQLRDYVDGLAR